MKIAFIKILRAVLHSGNACCHHSFPKALPSPLLSKLLYRAIMSLFNVDAELGLSYPVVRKDRWYFKIRY